jgi:DNA-binding response OmpR family regulator
MTETSGIQQGAKLNVYFIDDSATMREVVKIAFRRENFNIVTCADMASAVSQFGETSPHVVISDVIMPDKNGYELCQFIKQHADFGSVPVLLMSGVVNQEVAEKANDVKADELIRKPFHPQDLVDRVKKLLNVPGPVQTPAPPPASVSPAPADQSHPLGRLFERPAARPPQAPPPMASPFAAAGSARQPSAGMPAPTRNTGGNPQELNKLRNDVKRLESLVRKLQAELASEREYCAALEEQLRSVGAAE